MSIFEALMLICFGASWPFSVIKSYKTKSAKGKSCLFLVLVVFGYSFGVVHKIVYNYDFVIFLYAYNGLMAFWDLMLYFKYKKLDDALDLEDNNQINAA